MFRPRGVVNPIGFASPRMTKVLTCPVARVSTWVPPLPEKTWNSARWPSGDQAISCGANRQSGHLASWYLVPDGLIRYSSAGPVRPTGAADVYWARTQPVPTRFHGTLTRAVPAAGRAAATPAVAAAVSRTALSAVVTIAVREVRRRLMPS